MCSAVSGSCGCFVKIVPSATWKFAQFSHANRAGGDMRAARVLAVIPAVNRSEMSAQRAGPLRCCCCVAAKREREHTQKNANSSWLPFPVRFRTESSGRRHMVPAHSGAEMWGALRTYVCYSIYAAASERTQRERYKSKINAPKIRNLRPVFGAGAPEKGSMCIFVLSASFSRRRCVFLLLLLQSAPLYMELV